VPGDPYTNVLERGTITVVAVAFLGLRTIGASLQRGKASRRKRWGTVHSSCPRNILTVSGLNHLQRLAV
jgi:hypothetical protein